jgi:hypothetical protein
MHVFGHIHEAYGIHVEQNILFINAACLGELELIQHEPVVVGKCDRKCEKGRGQCIHPQALKFTPECSVADPGSGAFLTPGSGMGKKSGFGSGIRDEQPDHGSYFRELRAIFWVKILKFFDADPGWKKFGSGIRNTARMLLAAFSPVKHSPPPPRK